MEKTLEQTSNNCLKVVLFGPESTGKSTLTKALALHYKTTSVQEYMREYLQRKWDMHQTLCSREDLLPIAKGQIKLENEMVKNANDVLICDTNLRQIKVYSEVYYDGYCDPKIEFYSKKNQYDLYFLCGIDVPWEEDVLRDKPNDREFMFERFESELIKHKLPYVTLLGTHQERCNNAKTYIDQLIKSKN